MGSGSLKSFDFRDVFGRSWLGCSTTGRPYLEPSRTRIVMRQAVTTMILGVSLALVLSGRSRGDGTDVAATIDRARRLIQANDHSSAITFLEEALLEAQAKDRSAILDLLRQSYEVMARQAEASGRSRDAAHYRDNLAILNRSRESPSSPQTSAELPKTPVEPSKTPARPKSVPKGRQHRRWRDERTASFPADQNASSRPGFAKHAPRSSLSPSPTPPSEPLDTQPEKSSLSEPSSSNTTAGSGSTEPSKNESSLEPNASSDTKLPDRAASSSNESQPGREATVGSKPDVHKHQFGRSRSTIRRQALRRGGRLLRGARPPESIAEPMRKEHWAYCRWVEVVRRINARPKTPREWEEIDSEVQSIQQLTPKSWYGEYLRSKVAEARRSRPATRGSIE